MSRLREAWPPLLTAATGIGLAAVGFTLAWWAAVGPVGLALGVGTAFDLFAKRQVEIRPLLAARVFGWRWLQPASLAVAGAGAIVALGVWFEPSAEASLESKKVSAAALGALAAALTSLFVRSADSAAEDWIAQPASAAFKNALQDRLTAGTEPANATYDDQWHGKGWATRADREARARVIATGLA